jgi:GTP-binding protein EngB required for normal cell division
MTRATDPEGSLNSSQKLHLLTSAQYADRLLADIEAVLSAANSKSPFPKYKGDITPAQTKVVQDYLARFRAQVVRMLASQGIKPPLPEFGSIHSIRVTLAFVRIAFQECAPNRMRGYGEVPGAKIQELNGIVGEMTAAAEKLNEYLAQGLGQDLQARLERLQRSGDEINLLKSLERVINEHGLVEFRPALSMILDRLENRAFEIAVFGRVSSGKSSLLNYIVESDVLPVGVNPITAVPTRLAYGHQPALSVWFAHKSSERLEVSYLPEFVTEQQNPANSKHVTRITVQLPSPRLRDGVVLVDTPGLGSLATAGAVETLAYLPRCDLGVVLIDAGSTLTQDDLGTIQALYDAGVPASVLLSKADLLSSEDRGKVAQYIADHVQSQLGLKLSAHPVSVKPEHSALLDEWLQTEILPLYDRHQQLAQESIQRKVGGLRESVETALKMRLERPEKTPAESDSDLRDVDRLLRNAAGRFEEIREIYRITDEIRRFGDAGLAAAARRILDAWQQNSHSAIDAGTMVADTLTHLAAEQARPVFEALDSLAKELSRVLEAAAHALELPGTPGEDELSIVLKEMPRIDLGTLDVEVRPNILMNVWRSLAKRQVENKLRTQVGDMVAEAFSSYGRMLEAWARRMQGELQRRFDAQADAYRAHLDRVTGGRATTPQEKETIQRDLNSLKVSDARIEALGR